MPHDPPETVSVKLVDDATGDTLAVSQIPVTQLPDTFELQTSLEVAGQRYTVARAEPAKKVDFARERRLTLFLAKVEAVDPENVLFRLPTICGAALPETAPGRAAGGVSVLHEDAFRQTELVALAHAADITAELLAIQDIHVRAQVDLGWREMHVRGRIPRPLPAGLGWRDVKAHLGPHDPFGGIAIGDARRLVRGAVAVTMRHGVIVWGVESEGALDVLCLENAGLAAPRTITALRRVADELSLVLVDWCSCRAYGPNGARIDGALGDPWDEMQ